MEITGTINGVKKTFSVSGPATERDAVEMLVKIVPGFVADTKTEKPQPKTQSNDH